MQHLTHWLKLPFAAAARQRLRITKAIDRGLPPSSGGRLDAGSITERDLPERVAQLFVVVGRDLDPVVVGIDEVDRPGQVMIDDSRARQCRARPVAQLQRLQAVAEGDEARAVDAKRNGRVPHDGFAVTRKERQGRLAIAGLQDQGSHRVIGPYPQSGMAPQPEDAGIPRGGGIAIGHLEMDMIYARNLQAGRVLMFSGHPRQLSP